MLVLPKQERVEKQNQFGSVTVRGYKDFKRRKVCTANLSWNLKRDVGLIPVTFTLTEFTKPIII